MPVESDGEMEVIDHPNIFNEHQVRHPALGTHICVYVYVYVYYVCIYIYMYLRIMYYVCMYVCMYVCVCVYEF